MLAAGWGHSLHVRSSNVDVLLVTLTFGLVLILFALYLLYWVVRRWRGRDGRGKIYPQSKADRPWWILGLVLVGSGWALGTMFYTGTAMIIPEDVDAPTGFRFGLQYLSYFFWIVLVEYKLLGTFYTYRFKPDLRGEARRKPHALIRLAILITPAVFLAVLSMLLARCYRDDSDLGHCEVDWMWPTYTLILGYAIVFVFLFYKLWHTMSRAERANNHEMIRYAIFLSTSFTWPIFDAISQLTDLQDRVGVQQAVLIWALLIVLCNLGHVFILALRARMPIAKVEGGTGTLRDTTDPAEHTNEYAYATDTSSTGSPDALDTVNAAMSETPVTRPIVTPQKFVIVQRPNRDVRAVPPDARAYVESMPDEIADRVDRNMGIYGGATIRRDIVDQTDIEAAQKYLAADREAP